jgi:filamentous hemagglutinin
MTAAAGQMTLNVSQLNQIGGLLAEVNPDGSTNNAATQQLLGMVLQQLGGNFTQTTVSDHLHTNFVAEGGFGVQQVIAMVAAIAASIVTAGAAAAAMGATLATMTLGESIVVGMVSAMAGNLTSQIISGNGINFGSVLEAGLVGAVTAGLTNGITYNSSTGSFGLGNLNQGLNSLPQDTSTLGQLAGISNIGGSLVPEAGQAAAGNLPEELAAMGATATINAGVQTAVEGGSFLDNLKQAAVSDAAAAGAFAIGNAQENGSFGSGLSGELGYVAAHGLLGCAAGAAEGTGCAGGAIGSAAGAFLNTTVDANGNIPAPLDVAMTTLVGGLLAGAAGANAPGAVTAAENETLNNWLNHVRPGPMQLSEQERSDAALAACNQGDAASCNSYKSLQAVSQQRDADLANACSGGFGSASCRAQVTAALAGGNNVQAVNGKVYAFAPDSPAVKSLPDNYQTVYGGSFDGQVAQSTAQALPMAPVELPFAGILGRLLGSGATDTRAVTAPTITSLDSSVNALSPAQQARSWQGSGAYPGVDSYVDTVLPRGNYVVGAVPGQSPYYTSLDAFLGMDGTAGDYYRSLQIAPNANPAFPPYRNGVTIYQVNQDAPAAYGAGTVANPQFGPGGKPQYFIPDFGDVLTPLFSIPFKR